jgi:N-acetylneuraminate lyase
MMLGALATGAVAAIGSTYNIAAPLYLRLMEAFERGDLVMARRSQLQSVEMIRTIGKYPFHAAMKAVLGFHGFELGGCRLPQGRLSASEIASLRNELLSLGYLDWSRSDADALATS